MNQILIGVKFSTKERRVCDDIAQVCDFFLTLSVKWYTILLTTLTSTQEADYGQLQAVVPLLPGT